MLVTDGAGRIYFSVLLDVLMETQLIRAWIFLRSTNKHFNRGIKILAAIRECIKTPNIFLRK